MSYYLTTISHSTTGVKTITCGFPPVRAKITVTEGPATSPAHQSVGVTDMTNQICDTWVADQTNTPYADRFSDRMVSFYNFSAGSPNLLTRANHDSATATEYKYNVITANVNCQFLVEIWG